MPRALPIRARRPGVAASASVPRVAGWLVGALALALLMAGPTGGQPGGAASAPAPSPTVTVVTLNVLHGGAFSGRTGRDEHLEERFGLVVPALRALDPDVVGIQEASTSRERGNVAARLASALAFNYVYGAALFHLTSSSRFNEHVAAFMNFTEGPAVLSRFPIARQEVIKLPACSGLLDPRVLVYAELTTPWGVLPVFSTHISGVACQSDAVARLVSERRGALPGILMGDFNATEESPTITRLTQESGFVDAFRAANPGVVGPTVWQPGRLRLRGPRPERYGPRTGEPGRHRPAGAAPGRDASLAVRSLRSPGPTGPRSGHGHRPRESRGSDARGGRPSRACDARGALGVGARGSVEGSARG